MLWKNININSKSKKSLHLFNGLRSFISWCLFHVPLWRCSQNFTRSGPFYWKGSSWWLVCMIRYVRYLRITLIISIETCKEVTSTSFNLMQEAFIRRDEDWPEEGWFYSREGLDTFGDQRWTVKFNIHTSNGGWLICDQCHVRCKEGSFN